MAKFIGENNLVYLWTKIKAYVSNYVKIVDNDGVKTLTVGNISVTLYQRPAGGISRDDLSDDVQASLGKADTALQATEKGVANGLATLDANGLVPSSQLPSYVDDVIEAYPRSGQAELSAGWLSETNGGSALTPQAGKIYVLMADSASYATNTQFRWATSAYVKLNDGGLSEMTTAEMDAATNNWT